MKITWNILQGKTMTLLGISCILFCLSVVSPSLAESGTTLLHDPESPQGTAENRSIRLRGDSNYPPYEFTNDRGLPDGFNVDIVRAVAKAMGLELEIDLGPWDEVVTQLEEKKIDGLIGMFQTKERDKKFDFTIPPLFCFLCCLCERWLGNTLHK